jgi:hypothetical protein
MSVDPAISRFAALPLAAKIAAVARAVKRTEDHVREHDGHIGHPAEFPGDYCDYLGATLLQAPAGGSFSEAVFCLRYSRARVLERLAILDISAARKMLDAMSDLAIIPLPPSDAFAGFVEGGWLWGAGSGEGADHGLIERAERLARPLLAAGTARKVFIASYGIIGMADAARGLADAAPPFALAQEPVRTLQGDAVAVAIGLELPPLAI